MGKRISLALLAGLTAVVAVAATATADTRAFRDGDEEPFCETPGPCRDTDHWDFRRLTQSHGANYRIVRHGIRTARRWRTKDLGGRHGVTIKIGFNLDEGGYREREIRIRRRNGELWAAMFAGRYKGRRVAGPVRVWRPSRYSVKVGFPVDMLKDGIERYRWDVSLSLRRLECPGSCNNDDTESFVHRL